MQQEVCHFLWNRRLKYSVAPNLVDMGWTMITDAIRFILAKYEPVARHGDLFFAILHVSQRKLGGGPLCNTSGRYQILTFVAPTKWTSGNSKFRQVWKSPGFENLSLLGQMQ